MSLAYFLQRGEYTKGLDVIRKNNEKETIPYQLEFYNNMGEYKRVIDTGNTYLDELSQTKQVSFDLNSIETEQFRTTISVQISLVYAYLKLNSIKKANSKISWLRDKFPETQLALVSKLPHSEDLLTDPISLVIRLYEIYGLYAYTDNKNMEAIGNFLVGYEIASRQQITYYQMIMAYNLAICYGLIGNLEFARQKNNEALQYAKDLHNSQGKAYIMGWMATWDFIEFDLISMHERLLNIYELKSEIFDKQPIIFASIYLGVIDNLRGDINQAEFHIMTAMEMITNSDNKQYLPLVLFYQGIIRRSRQDYKGSIEALLQAIQIHDTDPILNEQGIISQANVYYHLFHTYMDLEKKDEAEKILHRLNVLLDRSNNDYVKIMVNTAQATYFKSQNSMAAKAKSIDLLESLISHPSFERGRFVSIYAMFQLYELQLEEYLISEDKELLDSNNELLSRISNLIKEQGLWSLYGEVLVLDAKFHLMTGNLRECQRIINQIRELAIDKELPILQSKVLEMEIEINQEVEKIDKLIKTHRQFIEQYQLDEIKDYLKMISDAFKRV